ncbi:MAG: PEP-CTERM sorting domain-containing protein [Luteolibacter sp.]
MDLATNEPYRNLFAPGVGVRLSTDNPGSNPLNLYDTEGTGGADDDLERNSTGSGLWAGGSHLGLVVNNVLIINTNTDLTTPNDAAAGGTMVLDFDLSLSEFGFDFIDLDTSANGSITFSDISGGSGSTTIGFAQFEQGYGGVFERANVTFGDRYANRVLGITASDLGLTSFDRVSFNLTSSGGIGTIYATTVPEPSTSLVAILGLAGMALSRKRR